MIAVQACIGSVTVMSGNSTEMCSDGTASDKNLRGGATLTNDYPLS